jgi:hypothetical protein
MDPINEVMVYNGKNSKELSIFLNTTILYDDGVAYIPEYSYLNNPLPVYPGYIVAKVANGLHIVSQDQAHLIYEAATTMKVIEALVDGMELELIRYNPYDKFKN